MKAITEHTHSAIRALIIVTIAALLGLTLAGCGSNDANKTGKLNVTVNAEGYNADTSTPVEIAVYKDDVKGLLEDEDATSDPEALTTFTGDANEQFEIAEAAYGTSVSIEPTSAYADTPQVQTQAGSWVKSHGKWWYKYADGTYPASDQAIIGGKTYSFDSAGYMKTGWKLEDGSWHYYKGSGAMATGWVKVKGAWYYMDSEGIMQTGWQQISGKWYYLKSSGAMATGWLQDQGSWYYLNSSGAMKTGWLKSGGKWYYMNPADGKMATGKQVISGKTYILASTGVMKTGWVQDGGKWYYANSSGACKTNGWAGNYYLASDGTMATSGWVDGGKYYVDGSGKWVKKPSAAQLTTKPGSTSTPSQGGSTGSNGSSSAQPSQPTAHEHSWVEQFKTVKKPVYKTNIVCSCGETFSSKADWTVHSKAAMLDDPQGLKGNHSYSSHAIKDGYTTEQVSDGYKCSTCGATK
jgi:glucan-binding YG repeat protein